MALDEYMVRKGGTLKGPFQADEVMSLIQSGEIRSADQISSGSFFTTASRFAAAIQNPEYEIPWERQAHIFTPPPASSVHEDPNQDPLSSVSNPYPVQNNRLDVALRGAISCGYFCSLLSILFWPALTALTGFLCGIFLFFQGRERHAAAIVLLSLCLGTLGMNLGGPSAGTDTSSLSSLTSAIRPAVVKVSSMNRKGEEIGSGSGFYIEPGFIVTNYHVVQGAYDVTFTAQDGSNIPCSRVMKLDLRRDLAVLEPSKALPVRLSLERQHIPEAGDRIAVIGSPMGFDGTLSEGIVSAHREDENGVSLIQISAPISLGSSGSPVVNESGRVIGIATMYFTGGQSLNFAVSVEELKEIIQEIQQ